MRPKVLFLDLVKNAEQDTLISSKILNFRSKYDLKGPQYGSKTCLAKN